MLPPGGENAITLFLQFTFFLPWKKGHFILFVLVQFGVFFVL